MARPNRRCRGGCNRRLRWSEWVTTKTCGTCSKRLMVPDDSVSKSRGVTTYDVGLFGHRTGLLANPVSANYGRLTPAIWDGAQDADLDGILRNRFPTAAQLAEDAERSARQAAEAAEAERREELRTHLAYPDHVPLSYLPSMK